MKTEKGWEAEEDRKRNREKERPAENTWEQREKGAAGWNPLVCFLRSMHKALSSILSAT